MNTIWHRIAGIVFRTESGIDIPRLRGTPFSQFEVPLDTPHDILLRFFCIGNKEASLGEGRLDVFPREIADILDTTILKSFANQQGTGRYFQVEKDQLILRDYKGLSLTVISRSKVCGYGAGIHLATNLRLHFSVFLPQFDAMAIHSGGIIRHGRALLLVAPDDGGKTTAVQLAQGCPILQDDQVILRRIGGVVNACATPFGRLTDSPNSTRLGAVFFLKQAPDFSIEAIHKREMLRCLWLGHSSFLAGLPKEGRVRAFDLLQAASSQAPAFHMRFQRDFIDWNAVDQAMNVG